jgi:transglutaminase-like putative cysteine protease
MGCSKGSIGFLLILVIIAEGYFLWWLKTDAPVGMIAWVIAWVETDDYESYYGSLAPDPPYTISAEDKQLLIDMVAESHALSGVQGDFETVAALRNLTREICPAIERRTLSNDPSEILDAFRSGTGGACGALSALYCAALIAHGYRARVIELIRDGNDIDQWRNGPVDTHVTVEVYLPEIGDWFVSDPYFNCYFLTPGSNRPLPAWYLQKIAVNPEMDISETGPIPIVETGQIIPVYDGYDTLPKIETYPVDPILMYQNVFLLYYDIYGRRPKDPVQKWSELITSRLSQSEKVVRILAEGQKPGTIYYFNQAANWLPVAGIVLLLLLLVPSGRSPVVEEEEIEEEEDE